MPLDAPRSASRRDPNAIEGFETPLRVHRSMCELMMNEVDLELESNGLVSLSLSIALALSLVRAVARYELPPCQHGKAPILLAGGSSNLHAGCYLTHARRVGLPLAGMVLLLAQTIPNKCMESPHWNWN